MGNIVRKRKGGCYWINERWGYVWQTSSAFARAYSRDMFEDSGFRLVLLMAPLYHLVEECKWPP